MSGVERILGHEPLKKIDVALKAPRSLVQARGFRAVLYPGDILRIPGFNSNDGQAQPQHRDSNHALCLHLPATQPRAAYPQRRSSNANGLRGQNLTESPQI